MEKGIDKVRDHLQHVVKYMKDSSKLGTAASFVVPSCYLDYVMKLYNGEDKGGVGYKEFVSNILSLVDTRYKDFVYQSGDQDLPVQMYHILRCGIVHSFSLVPDQRAVEKGGRSRSIVLGHLEHDGSIHLTPFSNGQIPDACAFIIETFIDDLERATDKLFEIAKSDSAIEKNILSWSKQYPMIAGLE